MPELTVVVPVFNGERFLAATLDSVLAQSMPDFELIVVNDGSTDRTAEILAGYASRDRRILSGWPQLRWIRGSGSGTSQSLAHQNRRVRTWGVY